MFESCGMVILSFNHPDLTAKCVEMALRFQRENQILLFHNGSKKENIDVLSQKFPGIHHHFVSQNRGYTGGANEGLRLGFRLWNWVYFVTNDTLLTAPRVGLPKKPGLYAPLIWNRKMSGWDSWGGYLDLCKANLRHSREAKDSAKKFEVFYVPGSAFLIHSRVFEKLGGFDEKLGTYWEDVDYSLRVQNAGFPAERFVGHEFVHKVGKTCHKDSHYTLFLFQRNRWRITFRYSYWFLIPGLFAWAIKEWLRLSYKILKQKRKTDWLLLNRAYLQTWKSN